MNAESAGSKEREQRASSSARIRAGAQSANAGVGEARANWPELISIAGGRPASFPQAGFRAKTKETVLATLLAEAAAGWRQWVWPVLSATAMRLWSRVESHRASQRQRTLRVVETVGMGEKRFVAIVEVQQARYLVGGGAAGVSLLARLDAAAPFSSALEEQAAQTASLAEEHLREAW